MGVELETAVECKYNPRCGGNRRAFGTGCPGSEDCPEAKNYEFFEKLEKERQARQQQEDKKSIAGYFNNGEGI